MSKFQRYLQKKFWATLSTNFLPGLTTFLILHLKSVEIWEYYLVGPITYLLSQHIRRNLYYTMIHPYISYCNIVWASNYPTKLLKLHSPQNRAVRMVFGPTCRLSTDQMYKVANILKLDQICTFQTSEFLFKNHCSLLPNTFFDYFTTVPSINPLLAA